MTRLDLNDAISEGVLGDTNQNPNHNLRQRARALWNSTHPEVAPAAVAPRMVDLIAQENLEALATLVVRHLKVAGPKVFVRMYYEETGVINTVQELDVPGTFAGFEDAVRALFGVVGALKFYLLSDKQNEQFTRIHSIDELRTFATMKPNPPIVHCYLSTPDETSPQDPPDAIQSFSGSMSSSTSRSSQDQRDFQSRLLVRDNLKCVVTGEKYARSRLNVQAAHIFPVGSSPAKIQLFNVPGVNESSNGILLNSFWHRMFDSGLWCMDENEIIHVNEKKVNDWVKDHKLGDKERTELLAKKGQKLLRHTNMPRPPTLLLRAKYQEFQNAMIQSAPASATTTTTTTTTPKASAPHKSICATQDCNREANQKCANTPKLCGKCCSSSTGPICHANKSHKSHK
jgi:hypothetical protein